MIYKYFCLIAVIFLFSCGNEKTCLEQDVSTGIIQYDLDLGTCLSKMKQTQYVIRTRDAYLLLKSQPDTAILRTFATLCDTIVLADSINFTRYSLLGFYAQGTGCSVGFARNVTSNATTKKYTYSIKVAVCGTCGYTDFKMNWVLVPKVPDDYTVDFVLTR